MAFVEDCELTVESSFEEGPYENECRLVLDSLNQDEKEHAARTSYRYLLSSRRRNDHPLSSQRDIYASKMVQRYLIVCRGNVEAALRRVRATIRHRKESDVDGIRLCFDDMKSDDDDDDDDGSSNSNKNKSKYKEHRDIIEKQLSLIKFYVQGQDKRGRPICVVGAKLPPANVVSVDAIIKSAIYLSERAFACGERITNGREEKAVIVYDFANFTVHDIAPVDVMKHALSWVKDHVPERIERVYLLDAPVIFRAFWRVIKIFVDPFTKRTIRFINGEEEKKQVLGEVIAEDQAMPWMFRGGKMKDTFDPTNEDLQRYLYDIPFDQPFCAKSVKMSLNDGEDKEEKMFRNTKVVGHCRVLASGRMYPLS